MQVKKLALSIASKLQPSSWRFYQDSIGLNLKECCSSIVIEDGPYENWQFKIHKRMPRFETKAHLIGGVGSTQMFEN